MKNADIENAENAIDNLEALSEGLLLGEDYCSVAIVQGAIEELRELLAAVTVPESQLRSLAYWIMTDILGHGTVGYDHIIPVLKKRLPTVLGVVIEETE